MVCSIISNTQFHVKVFQFNEFSSQIVADDGADNKYLLTPKNPSKKVAAKAKQTNGDTERAQTAEELQERLEVVRNKQSSKKSKPSERTIKKKQEKKLKKSKEMKKKLVSAAKSFKNEKMKEGKVKQEEDESKENVLNGEDVKPEVKPAKVFNEEGKMVFSKFEFAARTSQAKKSKKDSMLFNIHISSWHDQTDQRIHFTFYFSETVKDPKLLLQRIKKQKAEISDLIEKGETEKAGEIQKDLAWKKAFDKTEGKKVRSISSLFILPMMLNGSSVFFVAGQGQHHVAASGGEEEEGWKEEVQDRLEETRTEGGEGEGDTSKEARDQHSEEEGRQKEAQIEEVGETRTNHSRLLMRIKFCELLIVIETCQNCLLMDVIIKDILYYITSIQIYFILILEKVTLLLKRSESSSSY